MPYINYSKTYPEINLLQLCKTLFSSTGGYVHISNQSYKEGIDMPARSMEKYPDVWKKFPFFNGSKTNSKFSLVTYKSKNSEESGNINSVTAFQVRLKHDFPDDLPVDVLVRFDELNRKYGVKDRLFMPRPTYAILADGVTFIYVLEQPFILNTRPSKQRKAYKFLNRVMKGIVKKINWLDPRFGAVSSRLTLKVLIPKSIEKNWSYPEGFFTSKGTYYSGYGKPAPYFKKVHFKQVSGLAYPIQELADQVLRMTREEYENRKKIKRKRPKISLKGQIVMDIIQSFDPSSENIIRKQKIKYRSLTQIMEDRGRLIRALAPTCENDKRSRLLYMYANTLLTAGYTDIEIFEKLKLLNHMLPEPITESHLCNQIPNKVYKFREETFLKKLGITISEARKLGYQVSYFATNQEEYHRVYSRMYGEKQVQINRDRKERKIERARKLRKKGLTLKEIAKKLHVSVRTVSNYLKGRTSHASDNSKENHVPNLWGFLTIA